MGVCARGAGRGLDLVGGDWGGGNVGGTTNGACTSFVARGGRGSTQLQRCCALCCVSSRRGDALCLMSPCRSPLLPLLLCLHVAVSVAVCVAGCGAVVQLQTGNPKKNLPAAAWWLDSLPTAAAAGRVLPVLLQVPAVLGPAAVEGSGGAVASGPADSVMSGPSGGLSRLLRRGRRRRGTELV